MEYVLLKFGVCHLVVHNNGRPFKGAFSMIFTALNLNCNALNNHYHKGLTVEHFYQFLSKTETINLDDRDTCKCCVSIGVTVGYTLNSEPLYDTCITRSIFTIGCDFGFLLVLTYKPCVNSHKIILKLQLIT